MGRVYGLDAAGLVCSPLAGFYDRRSGTLPSVDGYNISRVAVRL
jgi:hypothetical protein